MRLEKEAERREDRRSVDVPEGRRKGDLGERRDGEKIYGSSVTRIIPWLKLNKFWAGQIKRNPHLGKLLEIHT